MHRAGRASVVAVGDGGGRRSACVWRRAHAGRGRSSHGHRRWWAADRHRGRGSVGRVALRVVVVHGVGRLGRVAGPRRRVVGVDGHVVGSSRLGLRRHQSGRSATAVQVAEGVGGRARLADCKKHCHEGKVTTFCAEWAAEDADAEHPALVTAQRFSSDCPPVWVRRQRTCEANEDREPRLGRSRRPGMDSRVRSSSAIGSHTTHRWAIPGALMGLHADRNFLEHDSPASSSPATVGALLVHDKFCSTCLSGAMERSRERLRAFAESRCRSRNTDVGAWVEMNGWGLCVTAPRAEDRSDGSCQARDVTRSRRSVNACDA